MTREECDALLAGIGLNWDRKRCQIVWRGCCEAPGSGLGAVSGWSLLDTRCAGHEEFVTPCNSFLPWGRQSSIMTFQRCLKRGHAWHIFVFPFFRFDASSLIMGDFCSLGLTFSAWAGPILPCGVRVSGREGQDLW